MTTIEIVTFKGSGKMYEVHRYKSSIENFDTAELIEEAKANIPQCRDMDFTMKAEDMATQALNFRLIRYGTNQQ